eukprot:680045-Pelagomonas_calceolata.AAC.1
MVIQHDNLVLFRQAPSRNKNVELDGQWYLSLWQHSWGCVERTILHVDSWTRSNTILFLSSV